VSLQLSDHDADLLDRPRTEHFLGTRPQVRQHVAQLCRPHLVLGADRQCATGKTHGFTSPGEFAPDDIRPPGCGRGTTQAFIPSLPLDQGAQRLSHGGRRGDPHEAVSVLRIDGPVVVTGWRRIELITFLSRASPLEVGPLPRIDSLVSVR
jgi:hypothetical protein